MKGFKTSILCALLIMLMAIGSIAIVPASAATAPTEGMSFNADDKYVMYNPLKTETLTFEAEIYLPDNGKNRSGTIVGNYFDVSGYSGNRFGVEIREYGYPQLYSEKTQNNLRSTVSLYDYCKNGEYVHLAITVERIADGKDKTHFYYNGVLVDTVEYEVPAGIFGSSCNLVVGGDHRGGNVQYYKGNIKNVALFTDIRTAEEIAADAASADSAVVSSKDNLSVCYDFTSNKKGNDLSGNNNWLVMQTEKGLTFTKNTDPAKLTKKPATPHTIEATVYVSPTVTGRAGAIVGNYDATTKNGQFALEIYNGGAVRLYYNDNNGSTKSMVFSAATSVLTGTWAHVAVVHLGNELQCYINGEYVESITTDVYDYQYATPTQPLCIGGDNRDGNGSYFKGIIKDVTMYSDVRTAAEIKSDYESGVVLTDGGLIAHYDMTEATSDDYVADLSGHGYDFSRIWMSKSGLDLSPYSYSFAVIGDTQKLNYYDTVTVGNTGEGSKMGAIYDWIVANKDVKNIQYVMGMGDVTDKDLDEEWVHAVNQFAKLEAAGIPYTVVRGNHESVAQYNKYMTGDGINYTDYIDGCYKKGDYTNSYVKFTVSGTKYMVFTLNFGAEDAVLNWAGDLIKANPDYRVILTTHCYLYRDGTTLDKGDVCPPDSTGSKTANNGDEMWDKLVRKYPNIFLVLSGHDPCANVIMTQTKGDYGNTVTQFLIDPQGIDAKYNYDTGMIALLHFTADGKNVAVEYVSGVTGKYFEVDNQFEFQLVYNDNNGVIRTELVSREGNIDTYRTYYTNGTYTEYTITNGISVTVTEVVKTTEGSVDTYTIYYSDGSTTSYTVTNGKDGKDGVDGKTPYIGDNGNWWIGNTDTGVRAEGGAVAEPDYGNKIVGGSCGGDLAWTVTDKNILLIEGKGSMTAYSVGKTPWVEYATVIEEIVIGEGITTIGNTAFYGFTSLESVKLPTTLLSIGEYAFFGCAELDEITVPTNTRVIGKYAFRKSGLTSITLRNPENWTVTGTTTPEYLELAGVAAAYITREYYTYEWTTKTAESGDVIASGNCGEDLIWTLTTDGTLTVKGEGSMGDFSYNTTPWYNYVGSIFAIVIEDGVTDIGRCAFYGADQLVSVIIPESVTVIDGYAFYGTASLETVTVPKAVKSIGVKAFGKSGLGEVYFIGSSGWTVGAVRVDVSDPETAAVYLTKTYSSTVWEVATVYTVRETYMPELVYAELKNIFESKGASFAAYTYSNAPFAIRDVYSISDCKVLSISIPIMKTLDADENGNFYFTVFVANNGYDTMATSTGKSYRIAINAEKYGLTANNADTYKWVKIDLTEYGIELSADETLAFGDATDTVIPAYLGNTSNSNAAVSLIRQEFPEMTGFFTRVGRGDTVKTHLGSLMFDFEIERTYSSEADAEYMAMLNAVKEKYEGKTLSILGDSISTFDGYSNNTDYNSTIGGNAIWYPTNNTNFYDYSYTYWGRLLNDLGMELCVNNSWSGSRVYNTAPKRALELDNDNGTAGDSTDDIAPDVIFFYMGINDIRKGSALGDLYGILTDTASTLTAEERIAAWLTTFSASNYTTFDQAYALSIMNMKEKYPEAEIWCSTLLYNNEDLFNEEEFVKYNYCIKALAEYFGCNVADQQNGYITEENCHAYGSDASSLHPSPLGHELMEKFIIEELYKAMTEDAE